MQIRQIAEEYIAKYPASISLINKENGGHGSGINVGSEKAVGKYLKVLDDVTPVANLDPVQLSGTVVKRASLHNADIIEGLDLHIGDMVYVEKGVLTCIRFSSIRPPLAF